MDEKDIKRLKRIELLEILYEQKKQLEQLQKENLMLKKAYHQKQIPPAALRSVFDAEESLSSKTDRNAAGGIDRQCFFSSDRYL